MEYVVYPVRVSNIHGKCRSNHIKLVHTHFYFQVHTRSAERLRDMCCKNGGCFIKVGQHIGSLEYLLPMEYIKTLQVLHSRAPHTHISDIYRTIEEEFYCKVIMVRTGP